MLESVLHVALELLDFFFFLVEKNLLVFKIDFERVVLILLALYFRLHLVELQLALFLLGFSLLHLGKTAISLTLSLSLDFHFGFLGFNDFLILYLLSLELGIVDDAVATGFRYNAGHNKRGNHAKSKCPDTG